MCWPNMKNRLKNRLEKQWKSGPVWSQNFQQKHHRRWPKYSYGIKNSVEKNGPPKSEEQGNIASEKKERNKNNFLISRTGALLAVKKCHQNKFVFKKRNQSWIPSKKLPLKKDFLCWSKNFFLYKKLKRKICTSPIKTLRELNHQNGFAIILL